MSLTPINQGIATGQSFEDRAGTADTFTSALGHVVLAFSSLELTLSRRIAHLISNSEEVGHLVAAELSFDKKVHLLASLVRLNPMRREFRSPLDDPTEGFGELVKTCFRAEQIRNQLIHSLWESIPLDSHRMLRFKHTAKAKHGFRTDIEELTSAAILDVADFIFKVADEVDFFFPSTEVIV